MQDVPAKYIYEPWKMPAEAQKKAKCIIGKDYPQPLVDHATKHKVGMRVEAGDCPVSGTGKG